MSAGFKSKRKAYSILEILIVVVIAALFATLTYSAMINYYRTSIMDSELHTLVSYIQRVRQQAVGNPTGSPYSIRFLGNSYVLYPGTVYAVSNPENESHALNIGVIISTTFTDDTVTFDNFTGRTGAAGYITISAFGIVKKVNINALGIVESIE